MRPAPHLTTGASHHSSTQVATAGTHTTDFQPMCPGDKVVRVGNALKLGLEFRRKNGIDAAAAATGEVVMMLGFIADYVAPRTADADACNQPQVMKACQDAIHR
ncbi:MAG TPA: hypothetical protein VGJ60_35800 [Chloroflexota bacterium]